MLFSLLTYRTSLQIVMRRNIFYILLLTNLSTLAQGQNLLTTKFHSLIGAFLEKIDSDDREKVIVQTDKSFYFAGEDIWLRAYCVNAFSHKISRNSKTLFVDVVNGRDSLVGQIMLNNALLKLDGKIDLPKVLPEGYYWLRAYTRKQLKHDLLSIFVQPLYVFNPGMGRSKNIRGATEETFADSFGTKSVTVKFYTEGGSIVAGNDIKITLVAADEYGKPKNVVGYVTDNTNVVVAKYSTGMTGMGTFHFFADGSTRYTAHTIYESGKVLNTVLATPDAYGYQLSLTSQNADSIFMTLSVGDSLYKKNKHSYVLGLSRDSLCYAAVGSDMYSFTIAKRNFPMGKATLIVFDDNERVVSERDLYITKNHFGLAIRPDRQNYGRRQKARLSITNSDQNQSKSRVAFFSIAVTDERAIDEPRMENFSNLINNDDIEFPFKNLKNPDLISYSPDELDLLMLAQPSTYLGWQRPSERNVKNSSAEELDTNFNNLAGRVLGRKKMSLKNKIVTLLYDNSQSILEIDTTDDNGRFHFKLPDNLLDSTRLFFQVADRKGVVEEDDSIAIDSTESPRFNTPATLKEKFWDLKIKNLEKAAFIEYDSAQVGKGVLLKPITVKAKRKPAVTYDESKRVSNFSRIIPGDQIGLNPNSIAIALLSTPGVSLQGRAVIIHGGGAPNEQGGTEPLLFIDGFQIYLQSIQYTLQEYLSTLNPRNIDFIEVLGGSDATVYGPGSDRGVVFVHTLNGGRLDSQEKQKGLKFFYAKGYFVSPIFQEPQYETEEQKNLPYADKRSTIYWNSNIIPDDRGKATVEFFTNDVPENYYISVLGITTAGIIFAANSKINEK
ncbi:MAG TPA: Plug domain-containing protein [Puia sp.]|nr:Plug domain-containing protein [Puia sp.]